MLKAVDKMLTKKKVDKSRVKSKVLSQQSSVDESGQE